MFDFILSATDGGARCGEFSTPHGVIQTPVFAPVGTLATVKSLTTQQLEAIGASLVLANNYHLHLRPGEDLVAEMGGLHQFMNWPHPLLTDSGGFQVFSLANTRQIDDDGVTFRSHIDGSPQRFTPESAIAMQEMIGADIIMAFDECAPPDDRAYNEAAMARTHAWAERCVRAKTRPDQALFGIVQGGTFPDLRQRSAAFIAALETPGIAIGGLSVGESKPAMHAMLDVLNAELPVDRPRYLMGVGSPEDLVNGVLRGVDIFDCVLPTRMARNNTALTRLGRLNLKNLPFARDQRPIDPGCDCFTCQHHTRAYLRHLISVSEMLAATLISIHNLRTLISLLSDMRDAIVGQHFQTFAADFLDNFQKHRPMEQ